MLRDHHAGRVRRIAFSVVDERDRKLFILWRFTDDGLSCIRTFRPPVSLETSFVHVAIPLNRICLRIAFYMVFLSLLRNRRIKPLSHERERMVMQRAVYAETRLTYRRLCTTVRTTTRLQQQMYDRPCGSSHRRHSATTKQHRTTWCCVQTIHPCDRRQEQFVQHSTYDCPRCSGNTNC